MRTAFIRFVCATALLGTAMALAPSPAEGQDKPWYKSPDEWRFDVGAYLWVVRLTGTQTLGTATVPLEIKVGDVISDLKAAATVHFEAGKGRWLGGLDVSYVNLGREDIEVSGAPPGTLAAYGFKFWQGELFGSYRLGQELAPQRFEVLFGVRGTSTDTEIELTPGGMPVTTGLKQSWADPFAGFRYSLDFTENHRWFFVARGDIGGLVSADIMINALGTLGFRISRVVDAALAFRYLYMDYQTGTEGSSDFFKYDAATWGPVLGVGIRF